VTLKRHPNLVDGIGGQHDDTQGEADVMFVESWAGIIVEEAGAEASRFGAYLDDSIIPSGHRRRLSQFARMAVSCGLSVAHAESSDLVFCSRYGDMELAFRLLQAMSKRELMSPAAFSMSVHNSVPGVMDLVRKSRVGHTAIAAGDQSLSAGLTEAWAKLHAKPKGKVTLVFAEAELPDAFTPLPKTQAPSLALALTVSLQRPSKFVGRISLMATDDTQSFVDAPTSEELVKRLSAIFGDNGARQFHWKSRGLFWSVEGTSDATS
jgi:hypothetical protein